MVPLAGARARLTCRGRSATVRVRASRRAERSRGRAYTRPAGSSLSALARERRRRAGHEAFSDRARVRAQNRYTGACCVDVAVQRRTWLAADRRRRSRVAERCCWPRRGLARRSTSRTTKAARGAYALGACSKPIDGPDVPPGTAELAARHRAIREDASRGCDAASTWERWYGVGVQRGVEGSTPFVSGAFGVGVRAHRSHPAAHRPSDALLRPWVVLAACSDEEKPAAGACTASEIRVPRARHSVLQIAAVDKTWRVGIRGEPRGREGASKRTRCAEAACQRLAAAAVGLAARTPCHAPVSRAPRGARSLWLSDRPDRTC